MASIGSLVAELSANTASFQKDMGKAAAILNSHAAGMNKTVAGIERGISKMGTAFVTAFSAAAIVRFGKSVLDMGEDFANLSEKTGVSVEKLSEFAHGAKLSDVSIEELSGGLRKLSTNMAEASTNGTGQMAEAFRALGTSVTDSNGKLRDTASVFEDLAGKFAGAKDGPEKAAIAVQLLGKSGSDLIPLLNGLSQTSEEARRLGLVMSKDAADNAKLFNDEMARMSTTLQMFVANSSNGASFLESMITALKGGQFVLMGFAQGFQELGTAIGGYAAAASAAVKLNFGEAKSIIKELDADLANIQKTGEAARAALFSASEALTTSTPDAQKITLPVIANTGQVKQYQSLLQELQKATHQAQIAITADETAASYERAALSRDEFMFKIKRLGLWVEENKKATEQQIQLREAFQAYIIAAEKRAAYESRSALQKLTDEWQDSTKQMQNATAQWTQASVEALTDFVTTGKADFKGLANSIIRDLVRIAIQQKIVGSFGTSTTAGTGLLGALGGLFAEGGNPPIGKPSIVGENGPEIIVPRSATTVIPNGVGVGGAVYNIDARGADREGLARLEAMIRQLNGSIEERAVAAWVRDRSRGGVTSSFR